MPYEKTGSHMEAILETAGIFLKRQGKRNVETI